MSPRATPARGPVSGIPAPRWSARLLAGAYFVVGAAWITLSGGLLRSLGDAALEQALETVKGIGFAAVSALVLYALARRHERNARAASRLADRSGLRQVLPGAAVPAR